MKVVRPAMSVSVASMMAASVWTSTELVGSSRITIGLLRRKARAREIRWRSPPDLAAAEFPKRSQRQSLGVVEIRESGVKRAS
jgi:hypothetical protein